MAAKKTRRDDELSARPAIRKTLLERIPDIESGFADQRERSDLIMDCWDIYNCKLGSRQNYNGTSQIFVPIVRNAIRARKTRFIGQIFPQTGRYVEVTSENGDIPHATMALVEHYIQRTRLKTQVMEALLVNGDVEGQYTIAVDWNEITRHTVSRETRGIDIGGLEHKELGETDKIVQEEVDESRPAVEVISDCDLLVLPATVDSIEEALEKGGSVTILRRWSKAQIRQKMKDGLFTKEAGETLLKSMQKKEATAYKNTAKENAKAAGIKGDGPVKHAQGFEVWTRLKVDGEWRLCRAFYGGDDIILGAKLNPNWCDRCSILSAPVEKVAGVFKGQSQIQSGVMDLQITANDVMNEAADNLNYALNPVTLVDPEKVARWESLVLDLGAVWPIGPDSAKVLEFPNVSERALSIIASLKNEIFQTLGVNPAMMPQQTGSRNKRNQAEVALEQQVDVMTTAESVSNIEMELLSPLVQWFVDLDHQHRDKDITIRMFGEVGLKATMERIKPIDMNNRFTLRWFGVEAARNAAQVQQQIALMGVVTKMPPQMMQGYKLNLAPFMVQIMESAFGPRLAPLILESVKDQLAVDPQVENEMMAEGFDVVVHPEDDDQAHMQAHMAMLQAGDPNGVVRAHMQRHQQQASMKRMAAMQQQMGQQGGQPGQGSGTPPGAQPQGPRMMKGPPGMIHADRMPRAGAVGMPRKM